MLDIKFIRENPEIVKSAAKHKNVDVDIDQLLEIDNDRRRRQTEIEQLQAKRNTFARNHNSSTVAVDQAQGKKIKQQLIEAEQHYKQLNTQYYELMLAVPNLPTDDTPVGQSEADNMVVKQWGDKPKFDFKAKNHWQLGKSHDWIDKERAAKVAGARFVYLKGSLVRLQFAMMNFAMQTLADESILADIIKQAGLKNVNSRAFVPVLPPAMARTEVYQATGRLNGEEETYKLADDELWLNASAEHTLCPMYMNEILAEANFPIRYVGYTTAFRREAGSYGRDTEGILRLHQFDKLEMQSFSLPEDSLNEHLFLIAIQEYLMQAMQLPYQVVLKCTADIGRPNARGVDIEAWLPGQDQYRETHTADYMTDFQARRLKTRVRRSNGQIDLVHTNDATALSQRPLIALIENNQQADGSVAVPQVLQKHYGADKL